MQTETSQSKTKTLALEVANEAPQDTSPTVCPAQTIFIASVQGVAISKLPTRKCFSLRSSVITLHPTDAYIVYNDLPNLNNLKRQFLDLYQGKPIMSTRPSGFFDGTEMPTAGWWEALWPDPAGVLATVGVRPGMEVIDLCSGDGWFTLHISKVVTGVGAIDIDRSPLDVARHRLNEDGLTS